MSVKLDTLPLKSWIPDLKKPLLIAGPCGAESEEQVLETARQLSAVEGVKIFRSGIWKPRTRPNSFEGVGLVGLKWLQGVKQETGLLTAVEVATTTHVEEALKHGIDVLWIGARTTVNPFSVQEIADALRGTDIPVMVKNPVNPDINLWVGALERLNIAGIKKLVAVHRGFSTVNKGVYRNAPMWHIPIELKLLLPELPVICDPSHISGKRSLLAEVMQRSIDLDFDGLMTEVHNNPDKALSDAKQQVTPVVFMELLAGLTYRTATANNAVYDYHVQELRAVIDRIDTQLLEAIAKRMEIVEKIGQHKKENNVTILQLERWFEVLNTRTIKGELLGLSKEFVTRLLDLVHEESIRKQQEVMDGINCKNS
jgi:chorismate mutase